MLTEDKSKQLFAILGITGWIALVSLLLMEQYFILNNERIDIPLVVKASSLNFFIFSTYIYLQKRQDLETAIDFYKMLWGLCSTATICTFSSVIINFFMTEISEHRSDTTFLLLNFLYQVELGLMIFFMLSIFLKWKKLILYTRIRYINKIWYIFEYLLITSLFLHFFHSSFIKLLFLPFVILLLVLSLVLSVHLSWIAFMNFRQKIMTLVFISIIMGCLWYFHEILNENTALRPISVDLSQSVFLSSLTYFTAIYGLASTLVTLFNLPTSSVFEEKFSKISGHQQVTESILEGQNEEQIYETLLDSAVNTLKADAVWLEIKVPHERFICKNIEKDEAETIRKAILETGYDYSDLLRLSRKMLSKSKENPISFGSVLAVPLLSQQNEVLGAMVMLKKMSNAFDNVMINLVNTYAAQAGLTLDNFKLVSEAVENERYKGEMMTAKRVQKRLLPKLQIENEHVEIIAKSFSFEEVGGDYYDYFQLSPKKYALIIGDVSGKGTSAAFNMAQMKGVFHTLVQLDLTPDLFMKFANDALCRCLGRGSFMTATYFIIDIEQEKVYYARAGHCPTLYFSNTTKTASYLSGEGLGLGILRKKYENHIQVEAFHYHSEDMLLLYTDGIVEAENDESRQEYGYERLKDFFEKFHATPTQDFTRLLLEDLHEFLGNKEPHDDHTFVMVKFK